MGSIPARRVLRILNKMRQKSSIFKFKNSKKVRFQFRRDQHKVWNTRNKNSKIKKISRKNLSQLNILNKKAMIAFLLIQKTIK